MCIEHKQYSKQSLIIIFISVSLERHARKYFNRFELCLVWNKFILNILLFTRVLFTHCSQTVSYESALFTSSVIQIALFKEKQW